MPLQSNYVVSVHLAAFEVNELIFKKKKRKMRKLSNFRKKGPNTSKLMTASPQDGNEARMNLSDKLLQFRRGK